MRKQAFLLLILCSFLLFGTVFAADGPNLIANSSVEFNSTGGSKPDNWDTYVSAGSPTIAIDTMQANSGSSSLKIETFNDVDRGLWNTGKFVLKPGTKVRMGLYYKTSNFLSYDTGTVHIILRRHQGKSTYVQEKFDLERNKNEWTSYISEIITIPGEADSFTVAIAIDKVKGTIVFDDVWLQVVEGEEDNFAPNPPGNPIASRQAENYIKLNWTIPLAATEDGDLPCLYKIYRSTDKNFIPSEDYLVSELAGNNTELWDYNIVNGIKYYYVIASMDKMGNIAYSEKLVASDKVFYSENLILNGSFEEWNSESKPVGFKIGGRAGAITPSNIYKVDGEYSAQINNLDASEYNTIGVTVSINEDTNYILIGWMKGENIVKGQGAQGARIYTSITSSASLSGTFDWREIRIEFNSGNKNSIDIVPYLHQSTGTVWFDNIQLYKLPLIDGTPPEAPSNLVATRENGTKKINLSWKPSEVAPDGDLPVTYRVYRGSSLDSMSCIMELPASDTRSWLDDDAGNLAFYYYITAIDEMGNESDHCNPAFVVQPSSIRGRTMSSEDESISLKGVTLSLIDTNLSTKSIDDGSFKFNFVIPGNYTLLVTMPCYKKQTIPIELDPGDELDLRDIFLEWDDIKPNEPDNLFADGDTHVGLIDLEWDKPEPADDDEIAESYNIYRSLKSDVQRIEDNFIANVKINYFRDRIKEMDWGKTFYYVVEAVDSAGNISLLGSNIASATVKAPPVPQIVSPTERELFIDKAPEFEWEISSNPDISGYIIEVSQDLSFPMGKTLREEEPSKKTFVWPKELEQSLWVWRVKAKFSTGVESAWSQTGEFVTLSLIENNKLVPYINIIPSVFRDKHVIISYLLTEEAEVQIKAYNLGGRNVSNLTSERQIPGRYEVIWDGKDAQGSELPNGLYFVQLVAKSEGGKEKVLKKVVVYR